MIKPRAFKNNHIGDIISDILDDGFKLRAMKLTRMSTQQARQFYAVHSERPFFDSLVKFMSSGPIVALVLEKDNAVEEFRKLIGSTDPAKAEEGTIRKKYAESMQENAIHGSDSDENATIEGNFFFSQFERF